MLKRLYFEKFYRSALMFMYREGKNCHSTYRIDEYVAKILWIGVLLEECVEELPVEKQVKTASTTTADDL